MQAKCSKQGYKGVKLGISFGSWKLELLQNQKVAPFSEKENSYVTQPKHMILDRN